MLPDFLIIGAAKSATTWLAARLDTHPGIHISRTEIHYFSRHHARPIAWYEAHFQAIVDEGLLGENSNTYLYTEEAPRRIQRALPEVRLVCVLRNPTERAYSGYCMQFEKGRVSGRIEDYLEPDSGGSVGGVDFLSQGLYARHIERFHHFFDASRVKVMFYDDLLVSSSAFLGEVLDFLRVDPSLLPPADGAPVNVRRASTYPALLRKAAAGMEASPAVKLCLQKVLARPWGRRLKERLASRQVHYPPLSRELEEKLVAYYAPDVSELESLIGRDLSGWRRRRARET